MSDGSGTTSVVQTPRKPRTERARTWRRTWPNFVEIELAELSRRLTEPGERECLRCYLLRMINEFGCDGTHRWTVCWRDLRAPRARGLVQRMQRRGGCCCDCEVIFNVFPDYPGSDEMLPCAGVARAGSAMPCYLRPLRKTA